MTKNIKDSLFINMLTIKEKKTEESPKPQPDANKEILCCQQKNHTDTAYIHLTLEMWSAFFRLALMYPRSRSSASPR